MDNLLFELRALAQRQSWTAEELTSAEDYFDKLNTGLEAPSIEGLKPRQVHDVESLAQRFLLST